MAWFHQTLLRPTGYLHSDCFREVAEGLQYALQALGHQVSFAENRIETHAVANIVFGAHLLSRSDAQALPLTVVVYNLEQLGISYTPPWYMSLASRVYIWDYSPQNVARWQAVPHRAQPMLLQIGYMPQLSRIPATAQQDIDVLFYGSMTERRKSIITELRSAGVSVQTAFGLYGERRDALISRSKIVLNIHAAEGALFESVRVSWLLANRKAVISEKSIDMADLADAVACCDYGQLTETCLRLLGDDRERYQLEQRGFLNFLERDQTAMLGNVLVKSGILAPVS